MLTGEVMTGGPGGVEVDTVKCRSAVDGLRLPTESLACAVTVCAPVDSGPGTTHEKLPTASATAVHAGVVEPSMNTDTVEPGSALPETVGEADVVAPSAGAVSTGTAGPWVSTVKSRRVELLELLPAESRATAIKLWAPSVSAVAGVHDQ